MTLDGHNITVRVSEGRYYRPLRPSIIHRPSMIDGYPDRPGSDVKDFEIFQRSVTVHDFAELSYEHYFGVMTIYRGK